MNFAFTHHEVAPNLHMFRTHMGRVDLMFNSYLLMAQKPVLLHTGSRPMWTGLREQVARILPLDQIAYVVIPHFEADECGALSLLLAETQPEVVTSRVGGGQLMGFGIYDRPRIVADGDKLDLGDRQLELIAAPSEMHLWDGLLAFDQKAGTLFSADFLSTWGGGSPPFTAEPDLPNMAQMARNGIPCTGPYERVVQRLLALDIRFVAPGHGSCFSDRIPELVRGYFTQNLPV